MGGVGWGGAGCCAVCCGVSGRLWAFQAMRFKSLRLLHWVPGGVGLGGVGWGGVGWGGVGWVGWGGVGGVGGVGWVGLDDFSVRIFVNFGISRFPPPPPNSDCILFHFGRQNKPPMISLGAAWATTDHFGGILPFSDFSRNPQIKKH